MELIPFYIDEVCSKSHFVSFIDKEVVCDDNKQETICQNNYGYVSMKKKQFVERRIVAPVLTRYILGDAWNELPHCSIFPLLPHKRVRPQCCTVDLS